MLGLIRRTTVALMGMMFLNACEVNYIFYNVFDISCYLKSFIYMHFCMIKLSILF